MRYNQGLATIYRSLFMAIPWLTVLQSVPWTDVISNAPKVADGAKRLWQKVGKQGAETASPTPAEGQTADDQPLAVLQAQVAALQSTVAGLQEELLASSELITNLAQQNSGLIQRAQAQGRRLAWLTAATVAACAGTVFMLVWVLSR